MDKPIISGGRPVPPMYIQKYERYLPNAYDESPTILEKVNKVITHLNQMGELTNNVVDQWNEVSDWLLTDGLTEEVFTRLDQMTQDGSLDKIINETIFAELNGKIDEIETGTNGRVATIEKDLQNPYTDIKLFGAKGDGVTNDSQAFISAQADAKAKGKRVFFPTGTYVLDASVSGEIVSMMGYNATLMISGDVSFTYGTDISIEGIEFIVSHQYTSTTSSVPFLITAKDSYEAGDISFRDVKYKVGVTTENGSVRGKRFARIYAKRLNVENILIENAFSGFTINNLVGNNTEFFNFKNIEFRNVQYGIYGNGDSPLVQSERFLNNILLQNVRLKNTASQANYYSQVNGADLMLLEKVKGVTVKDIVCERPVERALYLNIVENVDIDGVKLINSEGIKCSGYVNKSTGVRHLALKASIKNVNAYGGASKKVIMIYDIKNVYISDIKVTNNVEDAHETVILFERNVENCFIKGVEGRNTLRGFIQFIGSNVATYDVKFKNIHIEDCTFHNPNVLKKGYFAIRTDTVDPALSDPYPFEEIYLKNVAVINHMADEQNDNFMNLQYLSNANMPGLMSIDKVNGLYVDGIKVKGSYATNGGLTVGANSANVQLNYDAYIYDTSRLPLGVYASQPSQIRLKRPDGSRGVIDNVITSVTDVVTDIRLNHQGVMNAGVNFTYGQDYGLPFDTNLNSKMGLLEIIASNGEMMLASVTGTGLTKISGTSQTDVQNVDGFICAYLTNGKLYVRNRINAPLTMQIKLSYVNQV